MFDKRLSKSGGAFYFTDFPAIHANCQIEVRQTLIMYDFNEISDEELERMELAGNGNSWVGAMNMGFDGRIFQNPDPYTRLVPE